MVLPLVAGLAIAGIGLQAAGAYQSYQASKAVSAQQQHQAMLARQQAEYERQIEGQKRQAMELDARRRSLEQVRQAQRARSLALTTATSQGAQGGSALEGAYGQISGGLGTNLVGLFQNLEIGRNIFDLNAQISDVKGGIAQSQAAAAAQQSNLSLGSGLSSLGGSLLGIGSLFK